MLLAKDLLMASGGGGFDPTPVRFDYTGAVQTYTVPKGCRALDIDCVGSSGGEVKDKSGNYSNAFGKGGRVQCILSVTPGQILYIYVGNQPEIYDNANYGVIGQGGWNGGGYAYRPSSSALSGGGAGGGASDIRTVQASVNSWYDTSHSSWDTDSSLLSRLVVAGAGGGASGSTNNPGGAGGGLVGGDAYNDPGSNAIALGGTQTSGGYGTDNSGSFGKGADGNPGGGGAGSGWYGGGICASWCAGGSSYTHPTLCSDVVHTQGYSSAVGNGWIIITPVK